MAKNEERTTLVKGFIIKLNTETMRTDVYPFEERVTYTRTHVKAEAYVSKKLMLDNDAMIKVTELVQDEYERRVYDAAEVYATAVYRDRVYDVDENGNDNADAADVLDCKRIVVEVYNYSIVCMIQDSNRGYQAVKVRAYNVAECRSGLPQFQAYARDVLECKRSGLVTLYNTDGSTSEVNPADIDCKRIAAWDVDSKFRRSFKVACYLTADELSHIPFTVYKRGDNGDESTDK